MAAKRMRVFAGPNGSGKTTIFKGILAENRVQLGIYVNADDIEKTLSQTNFIDFSNYQLTLKEQEVKYFFRNSLFSPIKRNEPDLYSKLSIANNIFKTTAKIDSYLAADLAEFIRQQLLMKGISFTYETVMSHKGKIDFMQQAIDSGFRVYLYYIATEDPEINVNRVNVRIAQEGHSVDPEIIKKRYYKSLENLLPAVKATNRAYIFDNSQKQARLIAEVTDGQNVVINNLFDIPNWVAQYLYQE